MSKDEESTYLLFGQAILIEGYKSEDDKGLLTTKGYADEKAKYQTYENILYFQNYRDAIFEIIPAGNFEIHDQILKDYPSKQNLKLKELDNLEKLQKRAETEAGQFELGTEINMKSNVFFGTDVMFKHLDSQSYLCGTIQPSEGDNGAFAVKVSNQLSSDLIWKLLPYRSFEFNGMPIPFGSPIQIKNVANSSFLTFQKQGKQSTHQRKLNQKPIASHESFHIPIKKKSEHSRIYSCVSHSNDLSDNQQTPMPWKFMLHMNDVINQKLIQHDIVYFQHSENKGVLTAFKNTVALKESKKSKKSKSPSWVLSSYDCLWEIQKYENENQYILRHLMSGMTLSFVEKQSECGKRIIPMLTEIASAQQLGTIQMKVATKEIGEINSNSKVHFFKDNLLLNIAQNNFQVQVSEGDVLIDTTKIIQSNFHTIVESELEYTRRDLQLIEEQPKHCFIIMQIDDETKKQVLFALSFHQTLISLIDELRWGTVWAEKRITYYRMIMLNQSLQQIKGFIKNCDVSKAERQEILPIEKRQTICKDLGMSQLLFELLYYMKINKKENIFQHSHNEKEKFQDLYNTCYEVIQIMIKNHILFKVHVSRWIDFIVEDVIQNDSPARLNALMEILEGNNLIIQNFITDGFIEYLNQQFSNPKTENRQKYLKIFRALCIVNGKSMTKNQTYILNGFIRKCEGTQNSFNFKLEKDLLYIQASLNRAPQRWRQFTDYHKAVINEDREMWNYFIDYMHLLADLCYGRNKFVKSYFQKIYDLSSLIKLLNTTGVDEAYVPVLRLILHLYIQGSSYYPINLINRILTYESIVYQPTINSCKKQGKYWNQAISQLLQDLMRQLMGFKKLHNNPNQDIELQKYHMEQNQKLKIVLTALLKTIQLGYWTDLNELVKIIQKMQQILKNNPGDIMGQLTEKDKDKLTQKYIEIKSQLKLSTTRNKIIIDCQQIATEIIERIKDFQADLRMRQTCFLFKGLIFQNGISNQILKGDPKQSMEDGALRINQQKVKQWVAKLKLLEKKQPYLDQKNITRILVQISQYNDPRLISQSLSIMKKLYDSRGENISNFCELAIVDSGEYLEWYEYIAKRAEKFFVLQDQNTLKISAENQNPGYYNINRQANEIKDEGIMQDMYMFWQLMKNQNKISNMKNRSLGSSGMMYLLASDRLINIANERETNNKLNQKIMKSTQIHRLVLEYITNFQGEPEGLGAKLLHMCYIFLTGLIINNQESKFDIQKFVEPMKNHLRYNVGVVDFFKEMYDNNKNMLYNQDQIRNITTTICNIINTLPEQGYYRSKLLDFFRSLIFFNDTNLKFNQIMILKIMQDDSYNILVDVSREDKQRVVELVREFEEQNKMIDDEPLSLEIKISAELTYEYTFFQIMAVMIEGKNVVNIGKLTKRHPFQILVDYIQAAGKCWPLRRNIRTYLNKLYYINDGLECYLKTILWKDLKNMIFDLNCYIRSKVSSKVSDQQIQTIENPVRFTYMQSYLYLNLEEVLYSLYEILHHSTIVPEINTFIGIKKQKADKNDQYSPNISLAYAFLRITERLGWIKNYFYEHKCIYTCYLIKYIQGKLKVMIRDWPDDVFEEAIMQSIPTKIMSDSKQKRFPSKKQKDELRDAIINKLIAGDIQIVYTRMNLEEERQKPLTYDLVGDKKDTHKKDPDRRDIKKIEEEIKGRLLEMIMRGKKHESDRNKQLQDMLTTIENTVKLSKEFSNYAKQKFLTMANSFSSIDKDSSQIYGGVPYISKQEYIKIIIQMNSKDPQALSPELKIFFLKLMTRSISQKNSHDIEGKPIDQWQTTYWDGQQESICEQQKKMVNCGLATFLCELLTSDSIDDNIDLANEILICGIAFLLGGYKESQTSILNILNQDEDNKVLENIQKLIKKLGDLIYKNNQKKILISSDSNRTFETARCDNYDHYEIDKKWVTRKNVYEPDNAKEEQYKNTCITTFRRAFKFIQLLCENNNNQGKNFIREQQTKEGIKKLNSINFIQLATNQLRQMFKIFCNQTMQIPVFIMDFINQVTQIPIKQNQLVLMRSTTFFQDLSQLQDAFSKQQNPKDRQLGQDAIKALSQIYSKAVNIILSNFQGNENNTFQLLDEKPLSKFLRNILDKLIRSAGLTNLKTLKAKLKQSKEYVFEDDIQNIINILCIFKKMEEKVPDGKLVASYNEYKTNLRERNSEIKPQEIEQIRQSTQKHIKGQKPEVSYQSQHTQGNQQGMRLLTQPDINESPDVIELAESREGQDKEDFYSVIEYLQKRILKIEITGQNQSNQIVYFPKHPVFNSLSQQLRNQIMAEVKRESHREKIVTLFKLYPKIKMNIEHSFKLQKSSGITESYINNVKYISCIVSILITMMLMIHYTIVIQYQSAQFYIDSWLIWIIVKLLSLIHLGIGVYYFILWKRARVTLDQEGEADKISEPFYKDPGFIQQAIFFFFSVLGTFYEPYLFTLQLLDIFIMIDVLKDIFTAIAINISSLATVSVMGVAFMFIFCLIGFSNYMKNIYQNEGIDEMCGSVSSCILDMYVSGVIGQTSGKFDFTRFTYDSVYFVFFGMLFGNIISGIMISSFSEKRQAKDALEEDKRNNCYICNTNRDTIEKAGDTFQKHTKSNHFLWNYIFYKYALKKKDPTEYTGLQYYISDRVSKEEVEIDWIPDAEKGEFSVGDSVNNLMELTNAYQKKMNSNIEELDEKMQEINRGNDDVLRKSIQRLDDKMDDLKKDMDLISKEDVDQLDQKLQILKKSKDLKISQQEIMNKIQLLERDIEDQKRRKEEVLKQRVRQLEMRIEDMRRGLGNGSDAEML